MAQRFYSTSSTDESVDLREAVLRSLPADNGLYMPRSVPVMDEAFWAHWRGWSFAELGYRIVSSIFAGAAPEKPLRRMVTDAVNFDAPLVTIAEKMHVLELFHGPSLAFKDFGARFMARLMGWLTRDDERDLIVLVATSGDTGGAVASAFHGVPGTKVVVLYPSGKVSDLQEKQLTTLGDNITALEVAGTFDDCQRLVKAAFLHCELAEERNLTSANSINIARLIPQAFYYFHAARQLPEGAEPVFVVPSGNFGNLTAGLLANLMGLPVRQFIAATNVNDVVPAYLESGSYEPRPSQPTISNAMDVGAPSNFVRLLDLCHHEHGLMADRIVGCRFDDEQTRAAIREVKASTGYVIEPHGAVGCLAAGAWRADHPGDEMIVLETAHPSKFLDVMEEELGEGAVEIPERLACLADREKVAVKIPPDEEAFLRWLGEAKV
ncbi:MAG: threonine synthase [Verrucomicrobiota bacterium]|nr:threonine synthase [Verrucomicrobiota bacterium]